MVPADSDGVSRAPPYSGYCQPDFLARKGLSPSMACRSRHVPLRTSVHIAALQPRRGRNLCGLGSSRFARRYLGNRCFFLFLRLLRCFSSAGWLPLQDICSRRWVVPFGDPRVMRLCAPNRGFSQLAAPFFASESLGIRRVLLLVSLLPDETNLSGPSFP